MSNGVLVIQVWGKQKAAQASKKVKFQNTKQINLAEVLSKGNANQDGGKVSDHLIFSHFVVLVLRFVT